MRVCPSCGKANRPERKYCIRCGAKLVAKKKTRKRKPKTEVPETGRVVTGAKVMAAEAEAAASTESESETPHAQIVEEEWVRPSQVPRDRVRTTRRKHQKSELEKAREAFQRAQSADIDERMLRASEVKELFDEAESAAPAEPAAPVSDEVPPSVEEIHSVDASKVDDSEVRLLGAMSPMVDSTGATAMTSAATTPPPVSAAASDLSSSLYDSVEVDESKLPTVPAETPPPPAASAVEVESPPVTSPSPPATTTPSGAQPAAGIATCPQCGSVMYMDSFEYPPEIYSSMGQARLKQARFFVVQGKYEEARTVIRIARSLFDHANDAKGLEQADRLIESLARSS